MLRGLITAIRTLSILPVPGKDAEQMSSSLPWFPVAGFILGGICYAMVALMGLITKNIWPEGTAIIVLGCGVLITGGIHLDGLGDWADGFGGGRDKQKILAIMKDPHIGTFGVIVIAVVLLAKCITLTKLISFGETTWIIAAYIVSRTMQVELASSLPYAREEGTGALFISGARFSHRIAALCTAGVLLIIIQDPLVGIVTIGGGWTVCRIFAWHCSRRVGGITGDLLGAGSEIVETIILFSGVYYNGLHR